MGNSIEGKMIRSRLKNIIEDRVIRSRMKNIIEDKVIRNIMKEKKYNGKENRRSKKISKITSNT